ncbi:hypothetical protein HDU80_008692 [Chytriomyces hyalinus]|nr:hypothetical protein HDU80_008692 [Chytriomyces hyalinus]
MEHHPSPAPNKVVVQMPFFPVQMRIPLSHYVHVVPQTSGSESQLPSVPVPYIQQQHPPYVEEASTTIQAHAEEQTISHLTEPASLKTSHSSSKNSRHPCLHCARVFPFQSLLLEHQRTHTKERPFACLHAGCTKTYTTNNRLKVHMRSHSGERPYICVFEGCMFSARQASDLDYHTRIHVPESEKKRAKVFGLKPRIFCQTCNNQFRTATTLSQHHRAQPGCRPAALSMGVEGVEGDSVVVTVGGDGKIES